MVVYNKTFFEIKIMLIVEEIPISLSCSLLVICNTNTQTCQKDSPLLCSKWHVRERARERERERERSSTQRGNTISKIASVCC